MKLFKENKGSFSQKEKGWYRDWDEVPLLTQEGWGQILG